MQINPLDHLPFIRKRVRSIYRKLPPALATIYSPQDLEQEAIVAILQRSRRLKKQIENPQAWISCVISTHITDIFSDFFNSSETQTTFGEKVTLVEEQEDQFSFEFVDSVTPEFTLLAFEAFKHGELPPGYVDPDNFKHLRKKKDKKDTFSYLSEVWDEALSIHDLYQRMRQIGWQGAYYTLRTVLKRHKLKIGKILTKYVKGGSVMQVKKKDLEKLLTDLEMSPQDFQEAKQDQVFVDYVKEYLGFDITKDDVPQDKRDIFDLVLAFRKLLQLDQKKQELDAATKTKVTKLITSWEKVIEHVSDQKPVEFVEKLSRGRKPKKQAAPKQAKQSTQPATEKKSTAPRRRTGVVAAIREIFESGKQTVQEIEEELQRRGIEYAPATVRLQVSRLRKEKGISAPRSRSGVVAKIRELWEAGIREKGEIIKRLEEEGIQFSVATVNTQLTRLRKEAQQGG